MYAGIWQKVGECDDTPYDKTGVLRGFKTFRKLKSIREIIKFVKDSGDEATIKRAGLFGNDNGSCVTNHILERHLLEIKSVAELEALLQSEGMNEHPVISIQCFKDNVQWLGNVLEGGSCVENGNFGLAARYVRTMQLFDHFFEQDMKDGRCLKEMVQRILDTANDREKAIRVFARYGLDLYKLAGEPRPVL